MSRTLWALGGYAIAVAAVFLVVATKLDKQNAEREAAARISILQADLATAETQRKVDSVTVTKYVTRTQTARDTLLLRLTDTLAVKEYIYQTDTLRTACAACVASAARLSAVNDSLVKAWTARYNAVKPSKWDKVKPYVFLAGGFWVGAKLRVP